MTKFPTKIAANVLIFALFWISPALADSKSRFVRDNGSDTAIVFVHGVLSDGDSAWKSSTAYFPDLLTKDSTFNGADIFVLSYPTSLWATLSIDEIAEQMRIEMSAYGVDKRSKLIFVSHSMGGLVTRAYLLKNLATAKKTSFLYFFSTPTEGSQVASIAKIISGNPQFSGMQPMKDDGVLGDLLRNWLSADLKISSYCAYEKRSTYGQNVVTLASASNLCTKRLDPIDADHESIVKPDGNDSISFLALKAAFNEQSGSIGPISPEAYKSLERSLKDLHMTLMQNGEVLFPQMDAYIINPTQTGWNQLRNTAHSSLDQITEAVKQSMDYDSQFFSLGNEIILVASDARQQVNATYFNSFKNSRKEWNGKAFVLREFDDQRDMPTAAQVKEWRAQLQTHYDTLSKELERLLALAKSRT